MKGLNEFASRTRVPKQIRYKWTSKNEPGEMMYLDKNQLRVPEEYQRDLNDAKRKRIASNLNWAAFGVLLVARRKDGSLVTMDGQHRLAAALSRSDINQVPVIIFELAGGVQEEASDFLVANKDRKPLSGLDSFSAMVVAGNEAALKVKALIDMSGRSIGRNLTQISCLRTLTTFAENDYGALERAWPTLVDLCKGYKFDNRLVSAVVVLDQKIHDSNGLRRSVSEPKIHRKLIEIGFTDAMKALHQAASVYQYGGSYVWAKAILGLINRGLRYKYVFGSVSDSPLDS